MKDYKLRDLHASHTLGYKLRNLKFVFEEKTFREEKENKLYCARDGGQCKSRWK